MAIAKRYHFSGSIKNSSSNTIYCTGVKGRRFKTFTRLHAFCLGCHSFLNQTMSILLHRSSETDMPMVLDVSDHHQFSKYLVTDTFTASAPSACRRSVRAQNTRSRSNADIVRLRKRRHIKQMRQAEV